MKYAQQFLRGAGYYTSMHKLLAALTAALFIAGPLAAGAQDVPSYARPAPQDAQVRGRIVNFDGQFALQVRDEKGYVDSVRLHQGTIINPTGLTLAPGMIVSILGYNAGSFFAANEVDTPYTYYGGVPYYYGHPWFYYGPTVSLGFFFGNAGWWHGGYFGGPYHYYGGARVYGGPGVRGIYNGGRFVGHDYVAPRSAGGYYGGRGATRSAHGGGGGRH
jgi:hypothetical protein